MFDPDKPIEERNQDILGRYDYSEKLGNAILQYNGSDCLVIGLLGPWGHGKSSVIKMTITYIQSLYNDEKVHDNDALKRFLKIFTRNMVLSDNKEKPIIIEFNPWLFSSQNQLIKKFFDELIIAIDDKTIKKKIKAYANKLILPIIGLAGIADPSRTQILFKISELVKGTKSEEESLNDLKNDLDNLFKNLNRKLIVIIDDIDRLSPLEIRQTFQLVKLVADFPNTIYLLSFDKKMVIKALEDDKGISGEEYIKKIIQIPFEVPEVYKNSIDNFLFKQLKQFQITELNMNSFDSNAISIYDDLNLNINLRWNIYYIDALKYFFNNLRDVKLFINAFRFNYSIIKNEVNLVDFLAITAIQIFENDVYQEIRNNKEIFAGMFNYSTPDNKIQQVKGFCDYTTSKVTVTAYKEPVKKLLIEMFPKIRIAYKNEGAYYTNTKTKENEEFLEVWKKKGRICSPNVFDAYFKLSIPQIERKSINPNS